MGLHSFASVPSLTNADALKTIETPYRSRHASLSLCSPRDEDKRFSRRMSTLRLSLDELSSNLHTTVPTDDDEWGWFTDIEASSTSSSDEESDSPTATTSGSQRVIWRMFPPLTDLRFEPPFHSCDFPWLLSLSSTDPQTARLEVREFRIAGHGTYAEFHVMCWIGDAYFNTWKRFSAFKRFVHTELKTNGHRRSLRAWNDVLAHCSWFRSLNVEYLHQKCCYLETFAHTLLMEAESPYLLARFMACGA
ncbi:unnamed protein product [Aphanomyces euteiches]|uniref:PX domain-containing protein n=2 Tax=Aphanomyces euteiches TaxID=100861 RepID=A0A6G0X351_9STRA|nr:hypothetical protein Ae201684_009076 [Aphanomyces euteiches]KAH9073798.1 hypothetical protein Ae201684P_003301 [Aphanomyces euteiches]KAH9141980.1 hypothetical protein AeRB84_013900 [Aphanomyces euteiches]KAH9147226.1 hypothetical protein AeRB84_009104 [Aphanomyces euteiches]